jgi:ABC-type branched-subunit amino acid transport system substrate-binding protein
MHARKLGLIAAMIATGGLIMTGCGSAKPTVEPSYGPSGIALFGTDGIMSNEFGDDFKRPGLINGMSGTAALAPLSGSFTDRLLKIDPTLDSFNYAGEAYDAVVITALAAQSARSIDGATIATYIDGVTTTGTECDDVSSCLADIASGEDIAYHGVTLADGLTKSGEPATASFGTLHFGDDNHIDPQKTEYVDAGDPSTANTDAGPALAQTHYYGKGLTIGLLLPKSGALASEGKPILAGAALAIQDINEAGGVLGKPVTTDFRDDGTDPKKCIAGAQQLIADGVPAIIGPSFSGGTEAVIPIAVKAHVVLFSPSATSAALSSAKDNGLFFRTAPSDSLQAQAIADVITRSGAQRVFIVARGDTYGTGLEHDVTVALNADGIQGSSLISAEYSADPNADNSGTFAQIASEIGAFRPDAVLLIGYSEIGGMITAMSAVNLKFRST